VTAVALGLLVALQFPERAVREVAALREGVTPAAWLAAHPQDTLTIFRRDAIRENHASWCARATRAETLGDGTRIVRYAYFYPPAPGPSLALPQLEGERVIREQCLLGTIWLETPRTRPDSQAAATLASRTRDALAAVYGAVTPSRDAWFGRVPTDSQRRAMNGFGGAEALSLGLHFFGAAAWRVPGRWQRDSAVIVSAYDGRLARTEPGRVLAFAYLPIAQLGSFAREVDREAAAERRSTTLAVDAARLSGLGDAKVVQLVGLLVAAESAFTGRHPARPTAIDSSVVAALGDWLASARGLPTTRRAAALLAADQIVGSQAMVYVRAQRQDSARSALERLGAGFARDALGGGYNYTHTWLDEARRLDSAGPAGTLALLALLRSGFNENGMCGGGEDPMHRVIAAGEGLLAQVPPLDPRTAAEVHRLVGDAYADIVALAAGAGMEYTDTVTYVAEAPAARRNGIAHYRQSFVGDRDSPEARDAWLEAWRLIAGLPPSTTHFFCVYD